ncbi:MAG: nitroreductase/quinone reductase family protein [Candidatus Thermoplasmatota archaeon]|nr:nitroreductase/quinone reductase family protein [Candidatus Thermoplasmatota archaeon]
MDERVVQALERDRTVDITTVGRRTGLPRRIEIWFHNLDGKIYITGTPGPRSWYANLVVNPEFTFHIKGSVQADLPARAVPVIDKARRRDILSRILPRLGGQDELEPWVEGSPLVEVTLQIEG